MTDDPIRFERPDLLPAWVWVEPPPDFDAIRLRGQLFFEGLEESGIRVERIKPGGKYKPTAWQPWTYVFMMLPWADFAPYAEWFLARPMSIIMDVHFPIMNMEKAIGSSQVLIDIIDRKDVLLANLAMADAVTVSRPEWAADLAEINPNVYCLPDLEAPAWMYHDSDDDSDEEPSEAEVAEYEAGMRNAQQFGMRMVEIAQASVRVKQERLRARREMQL